MTRLRLGLVCIALLPASLFVLSTCGKDSSTAPSDPTPPAPVPASIEITPSSATLNSIDQTVQLAPVVLDENGAEIADASVTWTSGAVDVATVDDLGLVTAVNNGSAVITAQAGSLSASASITVSQVPVRIVIELPPPGGRFMQTDTGQVKLVATVQDRNGHPVAGAEVTWSSSDESVATVNDQGVVNEVSSGFTQITARSGDLSDSINYGVSISVALGRFYRATNGPDWTQNTNWLTDAPLEEWHGVTVGLFGQLTILNLNNNNLGGSIPMDVGQLWTLGELNLGSNRISGEIPATIGKLEFLGKLNLSDNQLSGEIPAELGRLKELEVLALDRNELTGELPAELGNLANLRELHLQENESLSGPLPDSFTNLELQTLNLDGTALCVPASPEFQTWIEGIDNVTASPCPDPETEVP